MTDKKRQSTEYGNRKDCSSYVKDILPILAEIIRPDQKIAELYRQLLPICIERNIRPPCSKTVERLVKSSGLYPAFAKHRVITSINATIAVDTQNPLTCLLQLAEFIQNNPVFTPMIKKQSVAQLKTILAAV